MLAEGLQHRCAVLGSAYHPGLQQLLGHLERSLAASEQRQELDASRLASHRPWRRKEAQEAEGKCAEMGIVDRGQLFVTRKAR